MVDTNKMTIISEIQDQLEIYDQKRNALLEDLSRFNEDQLRAKPDSKDWSLLQIIQHMVLAERDVLQYLPEPK